MWWLLGCCLINVSSLFLKWQIQKTKLTTLLQTFPVWKIWTLLPVCIIITTVTASWLHCHLNYSFLNYLWASPLRTVREPTHCPIIQSEGDAKLFFQPEACTRNSGEQRLLLQIQQPSYRQARKKPRHTHIDLGASNSLSIYETSDLSLFWVFLLFLL